MAQQALAPAFELTEYLYSALSLAERASYLRQAGERLEQIERRTPAARPLPWIAGNRKSHSRPVITLKNAFAWTA